MSLDKVVNELLKCRNYKIIKTLHFEQFKQPFEQISDGILEDNLRNPKNLKVAEIDYWLDNRKKLKLWYKLSNTTGHKYYIEIDDIEKTIKIVTGVKLRIRWQKKVEKHVKQKY